MRRVVITGLGLVTPLGSEVETVWQRLLAGRAGLRRIEHFDVNDLQAKVGGVVPKGAEDGEFNATDYMEPKELRRNDEFIVFGMGAATQAIRDSGFEPANDEERERAGVMMGSGIGGLNAIAETTLILEKGGPRRVSPFFIPSALLNLASGQISIRFGLQGPNHAVVTACSTGAHAIGDAARLIQIGDADLMVAGGCEAALGRLGLAGFAAAKALSTHYNDAPEKASRPWDKDRDGFVMGEGAGAVVLEEYEHAKRRGAKIYAEVRGYGLSADAHHMTAPPEDGDGGYRAMRNAMKDAQRDVAEVDYINAHGTSTPLGDIAETIAIK